MQMLSYRFWVLEMEGYMAALRDYLWARGYRLVVGSHVLSYAEMADPLRPVIYVFKRNGRGAELYDALTQEGIILVHCAGGMGRECAIETLQDWAAIHRSQHMPQDLGQRLHAAFLALLTGEWNGRRG